MTQNEDAVGAVCGLHAGCVVGVWDRGAKVEKLQRRSRGLQLQRLQRERCPQQRSQW